MILLIGTNNLIDPSADGTDNQIVAATRQIIASLKAILPSTTKFFLVSIPPNYQLGTKARIEDINNQMKSYASTGKYTFIDTYSRFLTSDGYLRPELYSNEKHDNSLDNVRNVHFSAAGYELLASIYNDYIL